MFKPSLYFLAALALSISSQAQSTFTRSSTIEMTLAAGAIASDAFTTHRFVEMQYQEANPVARPFLKSTPGYVAYFGGSFGAVVLGNHLLRNHPRWRHVLNWSVIATESTVSVTNMRLSPWPTSNCKSVFRATGIIIAPCH